MLTPVGEMRLPAVILTPVRTNDASGGQTVTYVESDPIFVALRPLTTTEAVQFGQVNADINHIGFGHWHDLNALTARHRIRLCETLQEFDVSGSPINSPKKDFTRLSLIERENG